MTYNEIMENQTKKLVDSIIMIRIMKDFIYIARKGSYL